MSKKVFAIQGMHCTGCAMTLDGALEEIEGVKEANTSFARSQVEVTFDPARVSVEQIVETICEAGYALRQVV